MERTLISELIGIEVTGMTVTELLTAEATADCRRMLDDHGVVVYRDLHIADDDLIRFGQGLGTLVVQPTGEHERPEIQVITFDPQFANPKMIPYRQGNFIWHFDGATDPYPQRATFLSAQVVDDGGGGNTEFASGYAAYEAMPEEMKAEIADLQVEHSFFAAQSRISPNASDDEKAVWRERPAQVHRLVFTRPDGRRSVLLGATASHVIGWSHDASEALFERLLAWCTQPQFTLSHHWRVGDLVVWDNVGLLHRAASFESTSPRRLHRITLRGAA